MTLTEAREAVSGKLKFGDDSQVQAKRFLDELDEMLILLGGANAALCTLCGGKGCVPHCDCGQCGEDDWLDQCPCCEGCGFVTQEDLDAAIDELVGIEDESRDALVELWKERLEARP